MSTLTGIFPNAITPTVHTLGDPAQQAQLRRTNDAAVFSPVGESEASAPGRNRTGGRSEGQRPAPGLSASRAKTEEPSGEADESDRPSRRTPEEQSSFQRQRAERQASNQASEQAQLEQELETIRELARRDREVRSHEQAHQAVGGPHAGAMSLTFEQGPDGKRYAVAGEVAIDISPVPGDPAATVDKAERVRRAALAPAEPSAQDRAVAAQATQLRFEAQAELQQMERREKTDSESEAEALREGSEASEASSDRSGSGRNAEAEDTARTDDARPAVNDRRLAVQSYQAPVHSVGESLDVLA